MTEDTTSYLAKHLFSLQTGKKSFEDVHDPVSGQDYLSIIEFPLDDFQNQETKSDPEEPTENTDESEQNPGDALVSQVVSEPSKTQHRVPSFVGGLFRKKSPTPPSSKNLKVALMEMYMLNKISSPGRIGNLRWTEYLQHYFAGQSLDCMLLKGKSVRFDQYCKAFMTAHKRFVYKPRKNEKVEKDGIWKKLPASDANAIVQKDYCGKNAEMAGSWFKNVSKGLTNDMIDWLFKDEEAQNLRDTLRNPDHVRKVIDFMDKQTLDQIHSKISKKIIHTRNTQTENTEERECKQVQTADANKLSALCFYHRILKRGLASSLDEKDECAVGLGKIIRMIELLLTQQGESQTGVQCLNDLKHLLQANTTEVQCYLHVYFETEAQFP